VRHLLWETFPDLIVDEMIECERLSCDDMPSNDESSVLFYSHSTHSPHSNTSISDLDMMELVRLLHILQRLPNESHLVLPVRVLLTRLSAALLYIVCQCFSEVAVVKDGSRSLLFLVCLQYQMCDKAVLHYLTSVTDKQLVQDKALLPSSCSSSVSESGPHCILSVFSVHSLLERRFLCYIRQINNHYMKLRMNFLLYQYRTTAALVKDCNNGSSTTAVKKDCNNIFSSTTSN